MKKFIYLTLIAALAFALVGCENIKETNSNKAVVVNDNANVRNMNLNTNTNMTSSRVDYNSNITREEYDKDKDRYASDAKQAGATIGQGVEDGWLWTKTKSALATTDDLRDSTINVDVENAVVTLRGSVGTAAQKAAAVKVAKAIDGVKDVKDSLTVNANDSMTNQMTTTNSNMRTNANMK